MIPVNFSLSPFRGLKSYIRTFSPGHSCPIPPTLVGGSLRLSPVDRSVILNCLQVKENISTA